MKRRFRNEKYSTMIPEIKRKLEAKTEGNTTEITIYGDIGESWWGDSVSAADMDEILKNVSTENITIRLNSPGGDAFDGITIYNRLRDHDAKVKIVVDGWACSAASIIAMAADELVMNTGSMLMIHEASTIVWGTKQDFEKEIELLKKLDKSLVDIYMTKAKVEREEIETLVNNETWFTAEEAETIGFASKVEEGKAEPTDPEAYKNSILARFQKEPMKPAASANILDRFKRRE